MELEAQLKKGGRMVVPIGLRTLLVVDREWDGSLQKREVTVDVDIPCMTTLEQQCP
jgi:protein-L-isoaspartate O-methyltransferase